MGHRRIPIVLGGALVLSLGLNVALAAGGPLFQGATLRYEQITGAPSIVTRHRQEVGRLSEELAAAESSLRNLYAKVAELSNTLLLERETNRGIRARYVVLSDELNALRAASDRTSP